MTGVFAYFQGPLYRGGAGLEMFKCLRESRVGVSRSGFLGGDNAHISLIKIQLTRFEDMAGASRVRPIINIHYLSSTDLKDILKHVHSHSRTHTSQEAGDTMRD